MNGNKLVYLLVALLAVTPFVSATVGAGKLYGNSTVTTVFNEKGLPSGSTFTVNYGGVSQSTAISAVSSNQTTFTNSPNQTLSYTVSSYVVAGVAGSNSVTYYPNPSSGTLGTGKSVTILFSTAQSSATTTNSTKNSTKTTVVQTTLPYTSLNSSTSTSTNSTSTSSYSSGSSTLYYVVGVIVVLVIIGALWMMTKKK